MKILIDQNISYRIVNRIHDNFPNAIHVKALGLINAPDFDIFKFARQHQFQAILTLDEDFYNILLEHNSPPKVIWVKTGNCSTAFLAQILIDNAALIQSFLENIELDCLELYR
jgi:predicted nuclease of predicted toxin-antitoxin system